jgi:hypothetical protein
MSSHHATVQNPYTREDKSFCQSSGRAVWGAGLDLSYTGSRARIPLKAWMFVVPRRQRPCDKLITRPRSPTVCQNRLGNQKIRGGEGPKLDCRSQWKKNKSFENVAKFKYLGSKETHQSYIHEGIRSRLNSENACYRAVQNLWSSHLPSKNIQIKMKKTMILPVVLYGCQTWSLTLRKEHRLRLFQNRILRGIFI